MATSTGRYEVVRYPTYYVVIDKHENHEIVFESRSRDTAHKEADKLNKAYQQERMAEKRASRAQKTGD